MAAAAGQQLRRKVYQSLPMTGCWIKRPGNNIQMPTAEDRCTMIGGHERINKEQRWQQQGGSFINLETF